MSTEDDSKPQPSSAFESALAYAQNVAPDNVQKGAEDDDEESVVDMEGKVQSKPHKLKTNTPQRS